MIRVRFFTTAEDYRPVNWPIPHPYWKTGEGEDSYGREASVIVAYADDADYISRNWPEATDLEVGEVDDYVFTSRFPKPDWFTEG
jgi:hypothetical protein